MKFSARRHSVAVRDTNSAYAAGQTAMAWMLTRSYPARIALLLGPAFPKDDVTAVCYEQAMRANPAIKRSPSRVTTKSYLGHQKPQTALYVSLLTLR